MRTLRRNAQRMYYALQIGEKPIYATDEDGNIKYYEDSDGNRYPLETGETKLVYATEKEFFGNIAMSGGEAREVEYGLDISQYQAVLVCQKGSVPLEEGALIWFRSPVAHEYGGAEVEIDTDDGIVRTTAPKAVSSDYMVIKASPSLNVDKYILAATNK